MRHASRVRTHAQERGSSRANATRPCPPRAAPRAGDATVHACPSPSGPTGTTPRLIRSSSVRERACSASSSALSACRASPESTSSRWRSAIALPEDALPQAPEAEAARLGQRAEAHRLDGGHRQVVLLGGGAEPPEPLAGPRDPRVHRPRDLGRLGDRLRFERALEQRERRLRVAPAERVLAELGERERLVGLEPGGGRERERLLVAREGGVEVAALAGEAPAVEQHLGNEVAGAQPRARWRGRGRATSRAASGRPSRSRRKPSRLSAPTRYARL